MSFIDLPDEELMLLLCIDSDFFEDPAAWCAEFRAVHKIYRDAVPKTSAESEALDQQYQAVLEKYRVAKAAGFRYRDTRVLDEQQEFNSIMQMIENRGR